MIKIHKPSRALATWLVVLGCSSDSDSQGATGASATPIAQGPTPPVSSAPVATSATLPASPAPPGALPAQQPGITPTPDAMSAVPQPGPVPVAAPAAPPGDDMAASGSGGGDPAPDRTPFMGDLDGDPAAPEFTVPNIPCGAPAASFLTIPAGNMVQIGGREVFVAYPCAREGAAVTFFLFIHGTLQEGQKIPFTIGNFPVHTKVDSDNFIVVAPQAIGTQWGRGDDGKDLPHLYEVIEWVYETFGTAFDIRNMWASGGSWGAAYLSSFACDPMLEGRLTGVRMVVGGGCPRCSDRLACIVAQQELELGGGMPLSDAEKEMRVMRSGIANFATAHGCGPRQGPTNIGPVRAWTWPDCDPGFAHSYYLGAGNHADRWNDPTAVDHMVKELKSID